LGLAAASCWSFQFIGSGFPMLGHAQLVFLEHALHQGLEVATLGFETGGELLPRGDRGPTLDFSGAVVAGSAPPVRTARREGGGIVRSFDEFTGRFHARGELGPEQGLEVTGFVFQTGFQRGAMVLYQGRELGVGFGGLDLGEYLVRGGIALLLALVPELAVGNRGVGGASLDQTCTDEEE